MGSIQGPTFCGKIVARIDARDGLKRGVSPALDETNDVFDSAGDSFSSGDEENIFFTASN